MVCICPFLFISYLPLSLSPYTDNEFCTLVSCYCAISRETRTVVLSIATILSIFSTVTRPLVGIDYQCRLRAIPIPPQSYFDLQDHPANLEARLSYLLKDCSEQYNIFGGRRPSKFPCRHRKSYPRDVSVCNWLDVRPSLKIFPLCHYISHRPQPVSCSSGMQPAVGCMSVETV